MFRTNPSELKRQLKKLGLKNVEVKNIEAEEVIIRTTDGREIVAVSPQVVIMEVPGASAMIQVVATELRERQPTIEEESEFSDDDVRLVAEQTGVSMEEAREALKEAGGDIAAAIILIEERKRAHEAS